MTGERKRAIWLVLSLSCLLQPAIAIANGEVLIDAVVSNDPERLNSSLHQGIDPNTPDPGGETALHQAVLLERENMIRRLLEAGADPRAATRNGVTPLYLAVLNGSPAVSKVLLDAGASPNARLLSGETLLMTAARVGVEKVAQHLLDYGALVGAREPGFGQTPLMIASRENHPAIVALLIRYGAAVNEATRVGLEPVAIPPCKGTGCGSEGVGINRSGVPDRGERYAGKGGMTSLLYAARDGHTEVAKLLLEAGADPEMAESNGIEPLLMALLNNQLGVAGLLLDQGVNINVDDFWGRTPLFAAVDYRNLDLNSALEDSPGDNHVDREALMPVIRRLLLAGAEVDARTREWPPEKKWLYALNDVSWVDFTGQTAFVRAALAGDVDVMRLLLEHGADPDIATYGGTTALMAASGVNWTVAQTYTVSDESLSEAVELCLFLGADVNARNSMGLTAVMGAANRGSNDIIQLLVNHGARLDVSDAAGRSPVDWAEGVFLAAVGAERKPETVALLQRLMTEEVADGGD